MSTQVKGRLGDRLIERGLCSARDVEVALSEQRRAWRPLGEILISLGFVKAEEVARLMAEDLGLAFVRAREVEPEAALKSAVDRDFVRRAGAFPLSLTDGVLRVAMVHPDDPEKVSIVRAHFPYPLELAVIPERDLAELVRAHLVDERLEVAQIFREVQRPVDGEWPVERLVAALLMDGVRRGATDIHIEPEERLTRVRYRVDGLLLQGENLPREANDAVISHIKVLANLDIAERRRPQDGRLRVTIDKRQVGMRLSIMPSSDGENVVLRILDRSAGMLAMNDLGIARQHQTLLRKIAQRDHGLFLVTGPTGSGKTTTLYSLLAEIDASVRNVATIEDPIEYRLPLLRQSQVDHGIGFGFKEGLRALLRQDPDVILVGEIRDQETADMAIKASMTGHLVFSTLHTNSALGAIPRLTDLGIDPYLVEDSLIGVLAQRLVRRVCSACAEPVAATDRDRKFLGDDVGRPQRGKGCMRCRESGYSGRLAICELLLPDEAMAEVLRSGSKLHELHRLAMAAGYQTINDDGRAKIRSGETTLDEVERVNRSHRLSAEEREDV